MRKENSFNYLGVAILLKYFPHKYAPITILLRLLEQSFRVSRQIATTVYGVVSCPKYLEGVLTSLSIWALAIFVF